MKKILKILGWGLGVVVLLIAVGVGYLFLRFPDVGPVQNMTVQATPERLARGEYLANHVCVCIDCHSTRNWEYFSGPLLPGTEGNGGEVFDEKMRNFQAIFILSLEVWIKYDVKCGLYFHI